MIGIILAVILICYIAIPIIFFIYFWRSRYCSCPYCGNRILKIDKSCSHCNKTMPKYETLDKKVIKVGKAWQESANIMATPECKRFDKLEKKK